MAHSLEAHSFNSSLEALEKQEKHSTDAIEKAKKEAEEIIAKARSDAQKVSEDAVEEGKRIREKVLANASKKLDVEKKEIMDDAVKQASVLKKNFDEAAAAKKLVDFVLS